jgi:hypothetical protein
VHVFNDACGQLLRSYASPASADYSAGTTSRRRTRRRPPPQNDTSQEPYERDPPMAGPIPLVLGPVLTRVASCQRPVWVVHGRACSARGPARTGLKLRSHLQWGSGGHRQQYRPSVVRLPARALAAAKPVLTRNTGSYMDEGPILPLDASPSPLSTHTYYARRVTWGPPLITYAFL